jgi:HK97 family phage major capsid protein
VKSSKEIREMIQEKVDELEALSQLVDEEDREFSPEEQQQADAIMQEIGEPAKEGAQATGMHRQLQRAQRIEAIKAENQQQRQTPLDSGDVQVHDTRITPVSRYRHGQLKAFRGEQAEEHAYRAGQFFRATLWQNPQAREWCRDNGLQIQASMSGSEDAAGGHLVPIEIEQAVINLREEYGVFRREAKVVPMASDTKTVPRRSSGLTAYFVADNSEVTASDKEWDQVNLVAKKLGVLAKYSSELAEDAVISIGDDLTDEIAYAFANKEDECGFKGDGTSTYGGITGVLNAVADGSRYEAAGGNIAFSDLDFADFEGMVGQLPQYAARNAKWYISRVGYYASMARLLDAAGGNTIETLSDGSRRLMFLGYPVVISQVLPDTTGDQANKSILAFGDLSMAATLGNRRGIRVLISPHRYMEYDQIGILGTERMDINVHERGDASNAGAIIVLDTPSS